MYSDEDVPKKSGIFDRLEHTKGITQRIEVTGLNSAPSSSIFSRLGGKTDDDIDLDDEKAVAFAGILKSAPKKVKPIESSETQFVSVLNKYFGHFLQIVSIKKASKPQQKAILVKRIPAKAATMIADEYEAERMETGEKSVKFSSTDEILEYESRKVQARSNRLRLVKTSQNIRARLGLTTKSLTTKSDNTLLHRTKKIIKMKQPVKRANGQTLNVSALRSDEVEQSVKSRLSMKNGPEVNKLVNRIGRVSLNSRLGTKLKNGNQKSNKASAASSVFDRLGFNKK